MILGIYGAGGAGREVIEIAKSQGTWDEIVFIDKTKRSEFPVKTMSFEQFIKSYTKENAKIVISIGETRDRETLRQKVMDSGYSFGNVIHPTAYISPEAKVGAGLIARANALVSCGVSIGENVQLFEGSTIGHDTIIGNDSMISAKVSIGGNCVIGCGVYFGMSAAVKEKINIGNHSTIGMSSAVFRDVGENMVVIGNPGRVMKTNTDSFIFH